MTIKTVAAIIENKGKILLMKRDNTSVFNRYWALPGGKIDEKEDAKETVIREVKEETNLDFKPSNFLGRYKEHFPQYNWDANAEVFLGEFSGSVKGNDESSDIKWFSFNEIKDMELAFHHKKIIQDFIKNEFA